MLDRMSPNGTWYDSETTAEEEEPIGMVVPIERGRWCASFQGKQLYDWRIQYSAPYHIKGMFAARETMCDSFLSYEDAREQVEWRRFLLSEELAKHASYVGADESDEL